MKIGSLKTIEQKSSR